MAPKAASDFLKQAAHEFVKLANGDANDGQAPDQEVYAHDAKDDANSNSNHGATVPPGRIKSKRDRFKPRLPSHAMDNARERIAAYELKHADVIDEYLKLKDEYRQAAAAVGQFEHSLRTLCRDLGKVYDKARETR